MALKNFSFPYSILQFPNVDPNTSVSQVKTFMPADGGAHLDFSDLLDGILLKDIMMQM